MDMKKVKIAILISDKINFKTKSMKKDRKVYFIILKVRIHQEDITLVNIYVPNIDPPKYKRKILEGFNKDIYRSFHPKE